MGSKSAQKLNEILKFSFIFIPIVAFKLVYYFMKAVVKFSISLFATKKSLEGEVILITGCGTGIGKAVVLKLARKYSDRVTLILWDYNLEALDKTALEARRLGTTKVIAYCIDVSNYRQVSDVANKIKNEVGNITILINNAGVSHNRAFMKLTPEQIQRTLRINFLSHFWTIREFLPNMIANNHGHIVGTCSMGGLAALRGNVPYYSSKYALRASIMALKDEVQNDPDKTGIHFTTVYPWFVKTPLLDQLDIKFRFPKLTPLVEPEYIADNIILGIETNTEHLLIPKTFVAFFWLLRIAPYKLRRRILDYSVHEYRGMEDD